MYEKKLGFKFYSFFTNILLPINIFTISLLLLSKFGLIANANEGEEMINAMYDLVVTAFFLICTILMHIKFNNSLKSAFIIFFIAYGFNIFSHTMLIVESFISSDGPSFSSGISTLLFYLIPCTIYMYKRRNIFTPGTWEYEMYSNYLEAKRRKYSPEKVKPDSRTTNTSKSLAKDNEDFLKYLNNLK